VTQKTFPSDITTKGEEQSRVSGALLIHRSMSKHSSKFRNAKPLADIYRSSQVTKLYWQNRISTYGK